MIEFNEAKQKKDRGVSVKEILNNTLNQADGIENVVVMAKNKDGEITVGYSWESALETLGMLDIGKQEVMETMYVDE